MKERKFVKLRVDMYDDTKSKIIDTMDERDIIQYIWIRLIALAGKVNLEGELFLSRNIPYTMETLAIEFNRDIIQVELAMKVLMDLEMIEFTEDKIYKVKNFAKHQNIKINKNNQIKENIVEEKNSDVEGEKLGENLVGDDLKNNNYKSIGEMIKKNTTEVENTVISKEEVNKNSNDNNINSCNQCRENSASIDSEFGVKSNTHNKSSINSSNAIRVDKIRNSETTNISIDIINNKNDNENIESINNTNNIDMIPSDANYNNDNTNNGLEIKKHAYEDNLQSSIPISLQKKNSKSRKKSNNKNGINEINLNDDDEEIVELCSGDVPLGKDEKVVMAFTM
ncbi:phage replisome organizer N-terminal domain-containing protein [Clostridium beijerinckii]|uniref:phage replisome organizer N-terminal domain-containing protein n=1 Tax=Clostridium beijerinckii TaxID=1520 RepID=UPI00047E4A24|nr:phage replisome organizer N-terminal domain-containing protein [Clostridium beijerinckii]